MKKMLNGKLNYILLVLVIFLTSFFSVEIKYKNNANKLLDENNETKKLLY